MALRPMGPTPHFPEIDDVADQVERFAFDVLQEIAEGGSLRIAHSEMNIGDENCAVVQFRGRCAQNHPPIATSSMNIRRTGFMLQAYDEQGADCWSAGLRAKTVNY